MKAEARANRKEAKAQLHHKNLTGESIRVIRHFFWVCSRREWRG